MLDGLRFLKPRKGRRNVAPGLGPGRGGPAPTRRFGVLRALGGIYDPGLTPGVSKAMAIGGAFRVPALRAHHLAHMES